MFNKSKKQKNVETNDENESTSQVVDSKQLKRLEKEASSMLPYIYFTGVIEMKSSSFEIHDFAFLTTMDDRLYGVYKIDGMNLSGITDMDLKIYM